MSSLVGRLLAGSMLLAALACAAPALAATVVVHLKLDRSSPVVHLSAGDSAGIRPATLSVHVGDSVIFENDDVSDHTATLLPNATRFSEPRWTNDVLKPFGAIGDDAWSTGTIAPGARSAPIQATKAGTFLYGCFYDYSAGMRGQIIVEH